MSESFTRPHGRHFTDDDDFTNGSNSSFCSNSSQSVEENFEEGTEIQKKDIKNFLRYLSEPNPLMKPEQREGFRIRNAVNQVFTELPNFFDEIRQKEENQVEQMDENFIDFGQCLHNDSHDEINVNAAPTNSHETRERSSGESGEEKTSEGNLKSLFRYHHDNPKARLVYKRYFDLFPTKHYASYICDLRDVLRSQKPDAFKQFNQNSQAQKEKAIVLSKTDLLFDSCFESGNLFQAWKTNDNEYNLILQNDINTKGNTQWFFFSVANAVKGQSYTFNIINLNKKTSLFQQGMLPCTYSVKRKQLKDVGWKREGYGIKYFPSNILKETKTIPSMQKSYHTLRFKYTFVESDDTVFFAYSFPYTYSHLNEYLKRIEENPQKSQHMHRKVGCKSLANNNIEVISITSASQEKREDRKFVYMMARQHPGETTGSYMIEGVINFLVEDSPEAQYLREHFIFKIIPMINVDGVIHGNNRCSLAGSDLNREWKDPDKKLYPCVHFIKNMIKKNAEQSETALLVDFHGHSKKMNGFFYGNNQAGRPELSRIFPLMMSKMNPRISFKDSRFKVQKYYESTARIALWRKLNIPNIFTLEASFYGYRNESGRHVNFTPQSYESIGRSVCQTLFEMASNDELVQTMLKNFDQMFYKSRSLLNNSQSIERPVNASKNAGNCESQESELQQESTLLEAVLFDLKNEQSLLQSGDAECSGSDSSCSEDELEDDLLLKILPKKHIKKANASKKTKAHLKIKKNSLSIAAQNSNTQSTPMAPIAIPSIASNPSASSSSSSTANSNKDSKNHHLHHHNHNQQQQQQLNAKGNSSQLPPKISSNRVSSDAANATVNALMATVGPHSGFPSNKSFEVKEKKRSFRQIQREKSSSMQFDKSARLSQQLINLPERITKSTQTDEDRSAIIQYSLNSTTAGVSTAIEQSSQSSACYYGDEDDALQITSSVQDQHMNSLASPWFSKTTYSANPFSNNNAIDVSTQSQQNPSQNQFPLNGPSARSYLIKTAYNNSNSCSQQQQQSSVNEENWRLHAYSTVLRSDELRILYAKNQNLLGYGLKNFCLTGQKVKDDQIGSAQLNLAKCIESFKGQASQQQYKEASTQTALERPKTTATGVNNPYIGTRHHSSHHNNSTTTSYNQSQSISQSSTAGNAIAVGMSNKGQQGKRGSNNRRSSTDSIVSAMNGLQFPSKKQNANIHPYANNMQNWNYRCNGDDEESLQQRFIQKRRNTSEQAKREPLLALIQRFNYQTSTVREENNHQQAPQTSLNNTLQEQKKVFQGQKKQLGEQDSQFILNPHFSDSAGQKFGNWLSYGSNVQQKTAVLEKEILSTQSSAQQSQQQRPATCLAALKTTPAYHLQKTASGFRQNDENENQAYSIKVTKNIGTSKNNNNNNNSNPINNNNNSNIFSITNCSNNEGVVNSSNRSYIIKSKRPLEAASINQ